MSKDTLRKISRSLPAEGAIISPGNRRSQHTQSENELKTKIEALDTSYKISSKRISAETRELKKILYDLQRELKVSQSSDHYIPSPMEDHQPGKRFRKNSRVKKEPSTEERSNVNSDNSSERSQDVDQSYEQSDVFNTNEKASTRKMSVIKRRRSSGNLNPLTAKKLKEPTTLMEEHPICETALESIEGSAREHEDTALLNNAERIFNDKDEILVGPDSEFGTRKRVEFADDLEIQERSNNPELIISNDQRKVRMESAEISLLVDSKEVTSDNSAESTCTSESDSDTSSFTRYGRKKLSAGDVRILNDRAPPRTHAVRGVNGYEPSLLQENRPRQRRMTVASHSVSTSTAPLASIREELPRTPLHPQPRKYSVPPVRDGRKLSLAQQHLMRFFPQNSYPEPGQINRASDIATSPSRGGARRSSVATRDQYSRGRRRTSSLLPPLKEEVKVHSTPGLWAGLQDCRYLRKEENDISIEDIFRKD